MWYERFICVAFLCIHDLFYGRDKRIKNVLANNVVQLSPNCVTIGLISWSKVTTDQEYARLQDHKWNFKCFVVVMVDAEFRICISTKAYKKLDIFTFGSLIFWYGRCVRIRFISEVSKDLNDMEKYYWLNIRE